MQKFPHHYKVAASAGPEGDVRLTGDGLDTLPSAPSAEFDGPGDRWSPETLLVAAIADCFVLSFRAIAKASRLSWTSLNCEASGTLEQSEGKAKFTQFVIQATLEVPQEANDERAYRILEKAEASCLITNSLVGATQLKATVSRDS